MLILFFAAAFAVAGCVIMIARVATTEPLTTTHRLQLERQMTVFVCILIVAVLVLGFSGERILP